MLIVRLGSISCARLQRDERGAEGGGGGGAEREMWVGRGDFKGEYCASLR